MFHDWIVAWCVLCIQPIHLDCVSILSKINVTVLFIIFSHHSIDTFLLHIHGQSLIQEVYVVCIFHNYEYQYCILRQTL